MSLGKLLSESPDFSTYAMKMINAGVAQTNYSEETQDLGITIGLSGMIFEADRENPRGHEGRMNGHEPFDPDDMREVFEQ